MSRFFKLNEQTAINLSAYAVIKYFMEYNLNVYCYNLNGDLVDTFSINMEDKDKFLKCLYGE